MAYKRKWKPSRTKAREYAQTMTEIEEFCRQNGIHKSKSSYYFTHDGKNYRVSNHSIEASNRCAFDEFGNQIREKYHSDKRDDDTVYIHASVTRIMQIYTDIIGGYELDGKGRRK